MVFDLTLTDEQQQTRQWAHDFARREMREATVDGVPVHRHYDEAEEFPWPVVQKAAGIGLYGLDYYQMVGQDPSGITSALVLEETFWGCAGIGLAIFGSGLALAGLVATGTGEQIGTWAPRIFGTPDDVKVGAYAVSEPGAGSDVSRIRTRATKVDGGWLLDGEKIWITNGGIADVHVVVATVDPSLGHRGQASFLVTGDAEGFAQTKKTRKLGIRASHTAELAMTDCFVPDEQLLGGQDRLDAKLERARNPDRERRSGALSTFEATRPIVGIQAVGVARAAYDASVTYARQRETFGVPIVQHQAIAFKLADMATDIDAARLLCWRGINMAVTQTPFLHAEGSMAKLHAGRVAVRVADEAIQIHGGFGYSREFDVEKFSRDAKIYEIFEGTKEIQQLVISRAITREG
ncbi:acyl-CoA dehydrogenase family protein [Egicoccus halophilus]|uniref:Acyl-CoA dehydrogenase n=1 Tax=Egicoccus halophilus TaxID=1670830 RepID=A0A8J3ACM8_9ACTN|nr:acyl-CoA dehydrogenase family protein [Egicoccus halophilus]GGI08809.1 acyl-CoA dehydrogenase [Egicoccus halophilus]